MLYCFICIITKRSWSSAIFLLYLKLHIKTNACVTSSKGQQIAQATKDLLFMLGKLTVKETEECSYEELSNVK